MPRKRKPPVAAAGVPYGQGQALANAQRQMPVQAPPPPAPVQSPAPAAGVPAPQPPAGGGGLAAAIAAASAMAPPSDGGLVKPTARPGEPVTAGLDIGAGPGLGKVGMVAAPEDDGALRALLIAYQRSPSQALARVIEVVRNRVDARAQMLARGQAAAAAVPADGRRPL